MDWVLTLHLKPLVIYTLIIDNKLLPKNSNCLNDLFKYLYFNSNCLKLLTQTDCCLIPFHFFYLNNFF